MRQPPPQPPEELPPYAAQPPQEPMQQPGGPYGPPPVQPQMPTGQQQGGQFGQAPGGQFAQQPGQQSVVGNWVTFSQLRGHPLVDASKGQEVGEVQNVLLDQRLQGIQALTYKAGLFQGTNSVPITQVRVGVDAVTFQPGMQAGQDTSAQSNLPKASDIIGRRVLTDTGRLLGVVHDLRFDQSSHRLLGLELAPEGGGRQLMGCREEFVPGSSILNFGPDAIIVIEGKLGGF